MDNYSELHTYIKQRIEKLTYKMEKKRHVGGAAANKEAKSRVRSAFEL